MNLHEYQAKEIMRKYGLPVQEGKVATTPEEAEKIAMEYNGCVMVKAQVHTGGRGKAGGVKYAETVDEVKNYSTSILAMKIKNLPVKKVLIAKAVDIKKEYYLAVIMDRDKKFPLVMASREGGWILKRLQERNPRQ